MPAKIESWYPFTAGCFAALGHLYWNPELPEALQNLMLAVVSISAIAVGFLATAKSILFSIGEREIIRDLKEVGAFSRLIDFLMAAVNLSFMLSIMSAVCLLVDIKSESLGQRLLLSFWMLLAVWAAAACYRVIRVLSEILRAS